MNEQKDLFEPKATKVKYASPKVTIISATEVDEFKAAALLIFTKQTRLVMSPSGLEEMQKKVVQDPDWAIAELDYMSKTIRSSWEFLDITFMIENVSRACARTRLASYAMQSMRVTDMSEVSFQKPDFGTNIDAEEYYDATLAEALESYKGCLAERMSKEDARGVLPLATHCNLVAKYNLRTLVDLIHARTSPRVQGEYRDIAQQMRESLCSMYSWAYMFLRNQNEIAHAVLEELDGVLKKMPDSYEARMLAAKVRDSLK
jgi:flavin-dependent thymidylate synthase